nr:hypothetical protein [uncultured Rhodopila sp.]
MTDFDAIRGVLSVFAPTAGWTCTKIGWRKAVQVEHRDLGVRICRVAEDGTVVVLKAEDPHAAAAALPAV